MVPTFAFVVVSITDTLPPPKLVTYARFPSGLTAIRFGSLPVPTVATTDLSAVSITDTVALQKFVTYARLPSGLNATPVGRWTTGMVAVTRYVDVVAAAVGHVSPPPVRRQSDAGRLRADGNRRNGPVRGTVDDRYGIGRI